jgi:matrixin
MGLPRFRFFQVLLKRPWVMMIIAAFALGFVGTSVLSRPVLAYNNSGNLPCKFSYSGGSNLLQVPYRNDPFLPPTGAYLTAFNSARSNWNGTATPVLFSSAPSGTHSFMAYAMGTDGPYGHATWACTWTAGIRIASTAELNTSRLSFQGPTVKQSVASHELGHFIGIRHSTVTPAVMNDNRNRLTVYTAQVDDICGVNHRYPSTIYPPACGY